MKENPASQPIDPRVVIGHVHLKVADLESALKFYCGVLGFELQQRFGSQAAFISAGGYHHHPFSEMDKAVIRMIILRPIKDICALWALANLTIARVMAPT